MPQLYNFESHVYFIMKWPSHHVNAIRNRKVILVWNSRRWEFSHVNTPLYGDPNERLHWRVNSERFNKKFKWRKGFRNPNCSLTPFFFNSSIEWADWYICFEVLSYFIDLCLLVCLLCFGIFTSFVSSCSYCFTGVQRAIPQSIRYSNDTDLVKSVPFKYIPGVMWVIPIWDVVDQADVGTFFLILH